MGPIRMSRVRSVNVTQAYWGNIDSLFQCYATARFINIITSSWCTILELYITMNNIDTMGNIDLQYRVYCIMLSASIDVKRQRFIYVISVNLLIKWS